MKILIGTPAYGGQVTVPYLTSLLATMAEAPARGIGIGLMPLANESLITRGRNRIAHEAINSKNSFDRLFFIDADIGWRPEDFFKIAESSQALIGGTYCAKAYPLHINVNPSEVDTMTFFPKGTRSVTEYEKFRLNYISDEVPVRHIPTGFMCIDIVMLLQLTEYVQSYEQPDVSGNIELHHDFFPCGVVGRDYLSEDWNFCRIAAEHGVIPHLNTSVLVDHYGTHTYRVKR